MYLFGEGTKAANHAKECIQEFLMYNGTDEFTSFHNIDLEGTILDLIIQDNRGLIIVEIKPYRISQIKKVTEGGAIQFIDRPPEYAPIDQAIQKMGCFFNAAKRKSIDIDARIVTIAVAYPFISLEEFKNSDLMRISDENLTLLKDDFECLDSFISRKERLFDFVYEAQSIEAGDVNFGDEVRDKIGCLFIEDYLQQKEIKKNKPQILEADLKVNSNKDLYYGICSFLMKNDITSGNIYSQSRELLDGLGDYMTAISIPWHYDVPSEDGIGYCLRDGVAPTWEKDASITVETGSRNRIEVRAGVGKRYCIDVHDDTSGLSELGDIDLNVPMHLKNEQIRKMFLRAFVLAKEEIDIISPWMNFGVVNGKFEDLMRTALQRGVTIKIIYGLKPDASDYNISRSRRSDEVAKHLKEIFAEFGNQLVIHRDNIHYKLVLCDEKFKLEGGYNYLSFVGDYSNEDTRKEGSPFGTNVEEIRLLREDYFKDVN